MIESELIQVISQVGFPIAIAIYLLITRDKVIDRNSIALDNLSDMIKELCNRN
jgi:hypothetical protein